MKKNQKIKHWLYGTFILFLCVLAYPPTYADTFPITAQLTGDLRDENPDNIIIDVTITENTSMTNSVNWLIDLNSPYHPDIKLHELYFNLVGDASDYSFWGFDPTSWTVTSPASVQGANGASGTTFLFESNDENPGTDITNNQSLSFSMTKIDGSELTVDDFTNADDWDATDSDLNVDDILTQIAAHVGGLRDVGADIGDTEGSGFAQGYFIGTPGTVPPPPNQSTVPEPSAILLLGFGLIGVAGIGRRKIKN